ncbi:hypothetical protein FRC06_007308 [Ceratobasidium sp. 370]|nr:hypothetical protein FRC06_007308 [Ceratobasidium sp. 370]
MSEANVDSRKAGRRAISNVRRSSQAQPILEYPRCGWSRHVYILTEKNLIPKDAHVLPEQIERVLRQVQNSAHYMPNAQLEVSLHCRLANVPSAETLFSKCSPPSSAPIGDQLDQFDPIPIASASLGQVHKVTVSPSILLSSQPVPVALKVQFPNIAESISSDLANISTLLNANALLPRGLYLNRTLKVMRGELADECDYEREG